MSSSLLIQVFVDDGNCLMVNVEMFTLIGNDGTAGNRQFGLGQTVLDVLVKQLFIIYDTAFIVIVENHKFLGNEGFDY